MVRLSVALLFLLSVALVSCVVTKEPEMQQQDNVLLMLHIQPAIYKLGDIKEGEAAIATFLVRNNSDNMIELTDIQTSCGCTAAEPDSFIIAPHTFTQLRVAVDTTAKQNNIKKSIQITDSLGHKASALLTFSVISNPHRLIQGKVKGIFDGQCASCHFEPLLKQRQPSKLYAVGCAMCHGDDGEGAYAPSLRSFHSLNQLTSTIEKGVGKPQMPGFSKRHGGPLDDAQIQALAKWLMALDSENNAR